MSEFRKTVEGEIYFVTLTVVGWIDVFTRTKYADIIVENLNYCREKEGLQIYSYVIMSNHIHLVLRRESEENLTELLGRFKSVTAKKIIKAIDEDAGESRKEWLLYMFAYFAKQNAQYSNYHFWQYTSHPILLDSNSIIDQKIEYIHQNPVKAGIVTDESTYLYSSANPDSPLIIDEL
jgi:putative transposase